MKTNYNLNDAILAFFLLWIMTIFLGANILFLPLVSILIILLSYLISTENIKFIDTAINRLKHNRRNKSLVKKLSRTKNAIINWSIFVSIGIFLIGNSANFGLVLLLAFLVLLLVKIKWNNIHNIAIKILKLCYLIFNIAFNIIRSIVLYIYNKLTLTINTIKKFKKESQMIKVSN